MAIYPVPSLHERLNVFFGDLFQEMRKAPPQAYGNFLARAEKEFRRVGCREKNSAGVENILIVRLDGIGDVILTSGFLREVRKNFPKARITLLVSSDTRSVVELCPYVNEILSLDRKFFYGSFVERLEKIAVFCRDNFWQKKFSIAFSPRWHNDTLPSLILAWMSGACERIGYGTYPFQSWTGDPPAHLAEQDNFFLTKNIVTPKNIIHDADKNFYLLVAAGLKVNQTDLELFYGTADSQHVREMLKDLPPNCKKVLFGLGGRDLNRHYPVEKYLLALKELAKKNLVFVIVGGKSELEDAKFIEQNMPRGKVLNLVGKTTLREVEALAAQADFYLGNDTGTLHIAAAAKIPVLGIYHTAADKANISPAVLCPFRRFAPYQTKAIILRPAHQLEDCAKRLPIYGWCHADKPHCITQITPQEIVEAFEKLEGL